MAIISVALTAVAYVISKKDFISPPFLFCLAFSLFELVCLAGSKSYDVTINPNTAVILISGMLIFIIVYASMTTLMDKYPVEDYATGRYEREIYIHPLAVSAVILFQVLTIYLFYQYITKLYIAATGSGGSLSEKINMYDRLMKFETERYDEIGIRPSSLYNKFNLISTYVPYVFLYATINNFSLGKRVQITQLLSIILMIVQIMMKGSRSPLFVVFTLAVVLFFVMRYKRQKSVSKKKSYLRKIALLTLLVFVSFFLILELMGRSGGNAGHALYIYAGAPIDNLDNYLQQDNIKRESNYFAEHTVNGIYSYLSDKHLLKREIESVNDVLPFVKSDNGKGMGNVFTMYYFYILDFGYAGIFPCTFLMALVYAWIYIRASRNKKMFNFWLFIYAYLSNAIIMSPFSNRFYETAATPGFLKLLLIDFVFVKLFVNENIRWGNLKFVYDIPRLRLRLRKKA